MRRAAWKGRSQRKTSRTVHVQAPAIDGLSRGVAAVEAAIAVLRKAPANCGGKRGLIALRLADDLTETLVRRGFRAEVLS